MKQWIDRVRLAHSGLPHSTPSGTPAASLPTAPPHSFGKNLELSPRMRALLWQRGFEQKDIALFLEPKLSHLGQPHAWPGIKEASELLCACLLEGKKLVVWGDYDVDGVTSTALVLQVLTHHGLPVQGYLPDRVKEGYGLNPESIERLAADGAEVLLTVDCGISDVEAVAHARACGMTVIISDHHLPPETLPDAQVLCNPHLGSCPCGSLAGVGVAFYLMAAVNTLLHPHTGQRMDMKKVLDLVALGTLADMAKLEGENRILVKKGLDIIAEGRRPGMSALKAVSNFSPAARLGAGQVVFNLAPRINAAGRMADAALALELLTTTDHDRAHEVAKLLDAHNTERRQEEDRVLQQALLQAEAQAASPALVVAGEGWNPGVIGIVASRLVENYHKPALVLCLQNVEQDAAPDGIFIPNPAPDTSTYKGSGRSLSGFDLYSALLQCSSHLLTFGGHKMAAGLRVQTTKLAAFREAFCQVACEVLGPEPRPGTLNLDGELNFAEASDFIFLKELELMQPFGVGNPEPVFRSPKLLVRKRKLFGPQRNHVNLELEDTTTKIVLHAKAWRSADSLPQSLEGARVQLAYSVGIDTYSGIANVDIKIKDILID